MDMWDQMLVNYYSDLHVYLPVSAYDDGRIKRAGVKFDDIEDLTDFWDELYISKRIPAKIYAEILYEIEEVL